jgi:hypothetical protein
LRTYRKNDLFIYCDVHLDLFAGGAGQGAFIPKIERMAVFVGTPVVPPEADIDSRCLFRISKYVIETLPDCVKWNLFPQGEIEVLGKAILWDVAFLDGRAAFEGKNILERGSG